MVWFSDILSWTKMSDYHIDTNLSMHPAFYFANMWGYLNAARTLAGLNRPTIMLDWISNPIEPQLRETQFLADGISQTYNLGNEWIGFGLDDEISTISAVETQSLINITMIKALPLQFDGATGDVTFDEIPPKDMAIWIVAYQDSYFDTPILPLPPTPDRYYLNLFIGIMQQAVYICWLEKFSKNTLFFNPKITTSGLNITNTNTHTQTMTAESKEERIILDGLLDGYMSALWKVGTL